MEAKINLKVNERDIRMNAFVQKALYGTIEGFLKSLNDLPEEIRKIEISIDK